MDEDRRRKSRYRVWFPITVVTEDGQEGTAITFDVSTTGLFMAAAGPLAVGSKVTLKFRIKEEEPDDHVVTGTIVRAEPHDEPPWRHRMGVDFDEPQPDLEELIERESSTQSEP